MSSSAVKKSLALFLVFFALLVGCTTTIKKRKDPVFNVSTDSLNAGLVNLVTCEHITLDGEDINTNGKDSSELEIDLINARNIPKSDDSLRAFGRPIALLMKNALKDRNEYDRLSVYFVQTDTSAVVVKRNWKGFIFPSTDLQ